SVWTSVTNRSRRSRTASNFRSERSRAWSTAAILEAAPPRLLLRRCRRRLELGEAGDRRGAWPESLEQELLRSPPRLERVEPAGARELCRGDAGQRLGPVGEGADTDACRLEPPKRCVHLSGRPQVSAGVVLGEALQQRSPVADSGVELVLDSARVVREALEPV